MQAAQNRSEPGSHPPIGCKWLTDRATASSVESCANESQVAPLQVELVPLPRVADATQAASGDPQKVSAGCKSGMRFLHVLPALMRGYTMVSYVGTALNNPLW